MEKKKSRKKTTPYAVQSRLSRTVKSLRDRRGLTITRLAELAGLRRATVSDLESLPSHANVTIATLTNLANGLGVEPKDLL